MAKTQVSTNKPGARRRARAEEKPKPLARNGFAPHKLRVNKLCGSEVFEIHHADGKHVKVLYSYHAAQLFRDTPAADQSWDLLKPRDRRRT